MVQQYAAPLDAAFAALADGTRRGVLERLGRADASVSDLAKAFRMTVTGMKKHIGVLERAGLVTTVKAGRVRTCRLGAGGLSEAAAWIELRRRTWNTRFDALEGVLGDLQREEGGHG